MKATRQFLVRQLKETFFSRYKQCNRSAVNQGVNIRDIDGPSKGCMVVLPTHICVGKDWEGWTNAQIHCTSMANSVVNAENIYMVSKGNASIGYQCAVYVCKDGSISQCSKVAMEGANTSETQQVVVICPNCTFTVCWVVDEVVDSLQDKCNIALYKYCTTTICCWVVNKITSSNEHQPDIRT